ncbi:hypothetical protein C8J57DRAFT_92269, partial [Mycena rebaudengoi]
ITVPDLWRSSLIIVHGSGSPARTIRFILPPGVRAGRKSLTSPHESSSYTMSIVRAVGIYKCPSHLSKDEFVRKVEAFMDTVFAVPIWQRNILKYELLVPNEKAGVERLGMPSPQGTVIIFAEWPSHEVLAEVSSDPGLLQMLAGAKEDLGVHLDSSTFTVDVIRKK